MCQNNVCSIMPEYLVYVFPNFAPFPAKTLEMHETTFCRHVDTFCKNVSVTLSQNNNVEMRERDGFRAFPHGVTHFVISEKRIDGGWHVSIARQFRIFMCTTSLLETIPKKCFVRRTTFYS
jgi:hypothetical protein